MFQLSRPAARTPTETGRFARFAAVGAAGAVTDFLILNLLRQELDWPLWLANGVSFSVAVLQNYVLNRRLTFPESRGQAVRNQLARFALVSVIGLAINQVVFLGLHHLTEPLWAARIAKPDLAHAVSYNAAKAVAIGVVLFWNYFVNRRWTFRTS